PPGHPGAIATTLTYREVGGDRSNSNANHTTRSVKPAYASTANQTPQSGRTIASRATSSGFRRRMSCDRHCAHCRPGCNSETLVREGRSTPLAVFSEPVPEYDALTMLSASIVDLDAIPVARLYPPLRAAATASAQ